VGEKKTDNRRQGPLSQTGKEKRRAKTPGGAPLDTRKADSKKPRVAGVKKGAGGPPRGGKKRPIKPPEKESRPTRDGGDAVLSKRGGAQEERKRQLRGGSSGRPKRDSEATL